MHPEFGVSGRGCISYKQAVLGISEDNRSIIYSGKSILVLLGGGEVGGWEVGKEGC